jgi:tetratricopeptide (TPR) repeat protein
VLLENAAAALNDLPARVDLQLTPPQPVLTASNSGDGNEVRATCTVNPRSPGNPLNNYLVAAESNANFRSAGVRAGDLVRYYVNLGNEVGDEAQLEKRTALELTVRRLDDRDPQNALIIEGGLTQPILYPQRLEIWRYSDKRMNEIRARLNLYEELRRPPIGWEPGPDEGALSQLLERLNQWVRNQPSDDAWQPTSRLSDLPLAVREGKGLAEVLAPQRLREGEYQAWEGRALQEAVWCRDVAQWAKGRAVTDDEVSAALFDWTVRNIWLTRPEEINGVFAPWQAMVYGRGTAADRVWVFVELCRQQGIDAVALTLGADSEDSARLLVAAASQRGWLLFEPELGLPLTAEKGARIATLADLIQTPDLLRQWNVEGGPAYAISDSQSQPIRAWIVASPTQLTRRSQLVQQAIRGENYVRLAADVEALASRLKEIDGLDSIGLWPRPFQSHVAQHEVRPSARMAAVRQFEPFAQRPRLWKARAMHFQGYKPIPADQRDDPLAAPRNGHQEAIGLYTHARVRPADRVLELLDESKRAIYSAAKREAGYWVGVLNYDLGQYENAIDWLDKRVLQREPDGPRAAAARYQLARCCEALGDYAQAIEWLRQDQESPQIHGNLLRAARLSKQLAESPATEPGENAAATP